MDKSETEQPETRENASSLFVLSAKNEERLKERARLLRDFIQNGSTRHIDLADVAYTLQTGRDAMEARLGIIAGSAEELTEKLNAFLMGKNSEDIISGRKNARITRSPCSQTMKTLLTSSAPGLRKEIQESAAALGKRI